MNMRSRLARLYDDSGVVSRRYGYFLLAFDAAMILYVIISSFFWGSQVIEIIDLVLGVFIAFDYTARVIVSRNRIRTAFGFWGLADLIVMLSLLAPIAAVALWMGVYPESFLAPMRPDILALQARLSAAAPAGDSQLKMGAPKPAGESHGEGHHEEASAHGEAH